jgi:hypothetical protein
MEKRSCIGKNALQKYQSFMNFKKARNTEFNHHTKAILTYNIPELYYHASLSIK